MQALFVARTRTVYILHWDFALRYRSEVTSVGIATLQLPSAKSSLRRHAEDGLDHWGLKWGWC